MDAPDVLLPFDPIAESSRCLVIVVFFKSRSEFFKRACLYAATAKDYQVLHDGSVHCACFAANLREATAAYGLITCLDSWHGNKIHLVYAGGRMVRDHRMLREALPCYISSCQVADVRAHCCRIEQHPFDRDPRAGRFGNIAYVRFSFDPPPNTRIRKILNPCKLLNLDGLSPKHPADLNAQIQAYAIASCIDWCPNFIKNFSPRLDHNSP